jgi:hypothetical protein
MSFEGEPTYYQYVGKGHKTGRRELPRPAFEAIRATLANAGKELATMGLRLVHLTRPGIRHRRTASDAPVARSLGVKLP